ncbi:mechanosensitive ion channel family protein [Parvularcula sp. ZS-1/3]|uniref:Mechanosensitive ion channel family protein n=1 Tax=Parvularcula mediterranea TaxID=2732508 RepID=A0A7Y3W6I8_9PROT|nr:DUF3772 domain-containing protein [Parvularcula mediterranea]NNU17392.1 mechanosensitive ion channel family protein [Parvularcula mediterranea]
MMRLILLLPLLLGLAWAQTYLEPGTPEFRAAIEARAAQIADIQSALEDENLANDRLLELREEVRELRLDAAGAEEPLGRQIEIVENDLSRLGPAPGEGQPPEAEDLAARRADLTERLVRLQASRAEIELNLARSLRLAEDIADRRREAFTGQILARGAFLFDPSVWREAVSTSLEGAGEARDVAERWRSELREKGRLNIAYGAIVGALVLALLLMIPARRFLQHMIFRRIEDLEPLHSRRVILAALRALARILPGVIGGFLVLEALSVGSALPGEAQALATSIWVGFLILLMTDGAVTGVFAPKSPAWRVAPLRDDSVLIVRALAFSAAAVIVADRVLMTGAEEFGTSAALDFVREAITAIALGALLFTLAQERLWAGPEREDEPEVEPTLGKGEAPPGAPERPTVAAATPLSPAATRKMWPRARFIGRLVGIAAILAVILGWVNLGYYATTRSFSLLALTGLVAAIRALLREGVRLLDQKFGSRPPEGEEHDESDRVLYSWIGIAIDIIALVLFVPPALLVLGAEWVDVRGWIVDAFVGFQIGSVRISFAKILSAIAMFLVLLWVTRLVQKTADTQFFPRSRMDPGVQNSLRTLMGYIGLIIAFVVSVGTLGFDLSNLAIIAGALSVGIGFGLQSIVNNFVSGLILLFERPIKVGDWIITNSGEGIVKKISVRSTEIETFDRSSVIVPNSELISSAVTNWTHKDKMGRMLIRIGAAYDSDAPTVIRILERVARENPDTLSTPAPIVVFEDFGASSLDFSLRTYIRDVGSSLRVRTALRLAIHKAFREEGIEIPFPQQDVHLRDVPEGFGGAKADEPKPDQPPELSE